MLDRCPVFSPAGRRDSQPAQPKTKKPRSIFRLGRRGTSFRSHETYLARQGEVKRGTPAEAESALPAVFLPFVCKSTLAGCEPTAELLAIDLQQPPNQASKVVDAQRSVSIRGDTRRDPIFGRPQRNAPILRFLRLSFRSHWPRKSARRFA